MAIYAISDLHLALGVEKPMDIFGGKWENYMEKLKIFWQDTVSADDYVIVPGDISWATYLEDGLRDFEFINNLPGKKIILKGNHDYWWSTLNKLETFLKNNGFTTIKFLHNNCYVIEDAVLCGSRGWKCPGDDEFGKEDMKMYNRELQRLELSLKCAVKAAADSDNRIRKIIAALHYMPFNIKKQPSGFVEIMKKYNVNVCIYGHLHGEGIKNSVEGNIDGIEYFLVSADYLGFKPIRINI